MTAEEAVAEAFARRVGPGRALADQAESVARACHRMAVRFHRGGKMLVFGNGAQATDAAHIAVEFVHPVIVGKRALPALSLAADSHAITGIARADGFDEVFAAQIRLLGVADDIAVGLSADGRCRNVRRALAVAHEMGMLTIALAGDGGDGDLAGDPAVDHVLVAGTDDPRIVKELSVTAYHVLWELVHVFVEQPGLLGAEAAR